MPKRWSAGGLRVLDASSIQAAVSELEVSLSPAQAEQLAAYAALLQRWNAAYNLTAITEDETVLTHHLLDSLSVVRLLLELRLAQPDEPVHVLDVGSGGGLPGIPLSIALPQWRFTLVDAVGKKVAFLNQVVAELRLANVVARHVRVETIKSGEFDLVLSRAFASLPDFLRLSRGALRRDGRWVAMRGVVDSAPATLWADVEIERIVRLRVPRLQAERHAVIARLVDVRRNPSP